ncbi:MAG TPA: SDR family NAD(P)-dependent oxidoreductase [Gordonia sp. (in: high G+C Gram-positive bacteria)]|uniref:SDR family NAD(P)-dependent oxidoreductase n=1 Tax=unclassified Gordonia (in: high G+C Gram-positive bacteria) TaxID=2657482 RepID=UPI000FB79ED2|nr:MULTISPECIES: SDR family NAD(P)-dependent oxidoreductase [unclassified Gordonia (in: high G+C Gram-positive bacteria)]RTL04244.1 MAG: SDR family NAD(P)-dependent oxidoreductase [Acidimicrobiia bacterium]HNP57422.1 SDR family NAD(P)-dependent oxidoreductase [Gordonia sp. (in: high G+C Gram-positive bacteria)]HRC50845.1 SDR family NAD(P)-dependent oxidoreductase [Gordonia sp. (in: high G+C Gram-positive bacteria)]
MEIQGRRILVTGASSGIGHALALELASRGARLVVTARSVDKLEELAAATDAEVFPADLSICGAAADLAARVGPVDILVNNAGAGLAAPVATIGDDEQARAAFELNYWSPLALIGALTPPVIVNVTSLAPVTPWPLSGGYAAAKAALSVATETLRMELPDTHVIEVVPGPVDTPVQAEVRLIPGSARVLDKLPTGSAERLARRIATAIERDRTRVVFPRIYYPALALPTIGRRILRVLARNVRTDDTVFRTGSQGDAASIAARASWRPRR